MRYINRLFWKMFGWELFWADLYKPLMFEGEIQHHYEFVDIWSKPETLKEKRDEFIDKVESLKTDRHYMLLNFNENLMIKVKQL